MISLVRMVIRRLQQPLRIAEVQVAEAEVQVAEAEVQGYLDQYKTFLIGFFNIDILEKLRKKNIQNRFKRVSDPKKRGVANLNSTKTSHALSYKKLISITALTSANMYRIILTLFFYFVPV
jgi:hypothetical protein